MTVRFRRLRLWWLRQHAYSRCWMWCQDCRWAQQAWAKGEFYTHDDPSWHINEILSRRPDFVTAPDEFIEFDTDEATFDAMMAEAEPGELIPPPTGPDIIIGSPDWKPRPTPRTWACAAKVWIR